MSNFTIKKTTKLELVAQIKHLTETNQNLMLQIKDMQNQIRQLLASKFAPKSERSKMHEQPDLFGFEEPEPPEETEESETESITYTRKKPKRRDLQDIAASGKYPVEQVIHDLPRTDQHCNDCNHALSRIGEDKSYMIERIPAQIKIIEHIRLKYACSCCEGSVKSAELPKFPIPKSIAMPSLLAHTIVSKYCDHLPLYRQSQIWAREGFDISRSTMSNWIVVLNGLFQPLIHELKNNIVSGALIQADESHVQVMSEDERKNTAKSYMWVFKGGPPDKPSVVFEYHPTRSGGVAQQFTKGFKGYLQSDGYQGYNFAKADPGITQVYCMAHARRKFMDVAKITKKSGLAHEAIKMIAELYKIEKQAKKLKLNAQERFLLREKKARSTMDKLKAWLDKNIQTILPKSATGAAMAYMIKHWDGLYRYLDNGNIEIDNNAVENLIRPLALGRKNYLFMGSPDGAKAAANIYSLLATCKANGISPYQYFKIMLEKIRYCKSPEDYRVLLPQNIQLD